PWPSSTTTSSVSGRTRSGRPSRFTSPILTPPGWEPTGKLAGAPNVPSPFPSNTETLWDVRFATARSGRLSPFRSRLATPSGHPLCGHGQVELRVPVEVGHDDCDRKASDLELGGRSECPVAVAEQDGDLLRAPGGGDHVAMTVPVQVGHRDGNGLVPDLVAHGRPIAAVRP